MAKKPKPAKKSTVKYPKIKDRSVIPVAHVKHTDKRVNIPTEELRDFVAEDEAAPKKMLYPRDPSLDPQLVWKGKDEQDAKPLEVPVVPIYIQEKIQPQAIIEDVRAQARKEKPQDQFGLFADFNGIKFEEMIDFYQHEQNWSNRAILGDSLLVLTSLSEKEGLKGKVQSIYFDPPYGIKFGSNWQVSTRKRDVKDGKVEDATRQPEQVRAFRDTWQLGIHSYLAYLRDRFVACRDLLTESGSLFVQIGDENAHLVRSILDEVFGAENFVSQIVFAKTSSATAEYLATVNDYLLWYAKSRDRLKFRPLFVARDAPVDDEDSKYDQVQLSDGHRRALTIAEKDGDSPLPVGAKPYRLSGIDSQTGTVNTRFPVNFEGSDFFPSGTRGWSSSKGGMDRLILAKRVQRSTSIINYVRFFTDYPYYPIANVWSDIGGAVQSRSDPKVYVVQTGTAPVQRCLLMTTDAGDLVLDPTCGSGTTAYVAEQWGRRWITIDTSRVALALARTRLMAAKYPYYHLADSSEGVMKESEATGRLPAESRKFEHDIKKGFVYKRVPHITLKSIANNEEIDAIHFKWQEKLEPVRKELNKSIKESWEEWQIPRESDEKWSDKAKQLHQEWWNNRRARQKEIDDSIARHADTELLYDQPYEDNKRIRVTGPFTVESLSPHRVLSPADQNLDGTVTEQEARKQQDFVSMILDNLRKAGVQNTIKNERLKFDRLESFAGLWLHAQGEYTESGKTRRVAVSIGPEHGTVGPQLVKEAAKEAVQGVGFDLLIVCGFAFDPHVSEEVKRYGKLTVQTARMNPDLAMGDELLKKTGAGNLFMVFGEPDMDVKTAKDGKIVVTIKGLDVYDPTTGQIRSSSTDDIACWFIDTNYNGESFFVRHAYFTGADEPYEKLKRALRAQIDEAAWSALYSTKSRPFDPPTTGKIAVKVINHYGDEVLKVFEPK
jgi:adenine-specific DNA-methyltransferase